jgi:hypothetical protein
LHSATFSSDNTDFVAVVFSRLCGQNRLYLTGSKPHRAISTRRKRRPKIKGLSFSEWWDFYCVWGTKGKGWN